VPFRDSKLTRILEDSVGGNCKTSLLVCCSPAAESCSETLSALEFASRAMKVRFLGDAKSSLGDAKSSLGNAKSSLGDAKGSLGGAKSSLGGAKSSLGFV
jgi:hypothetical protein